MGVDGPFETIGFIFAMPIELAPFAERSRSSRPRSAASRPRRNAGGRDVVAIVTGMGIELRAPKARTRLLDAVPVERVVVVGITGALENETPIGTLILPEVVVQQRDRT